MSASSQLPFTAPVPASSRSRALRWPLLFISLVAVVLAGLELSARVLITRVSRIESRAVREYNAVRQPVGRRPYLLMVGNSLLNAAVDFPAFQSAVAPTLDARRFCVEQTGYYDWFFGLRRLFSEGARPGVVALMLSDSQFVSREVRGDYFALRLMRPQDITDVARDLHLHPTEAAGMFLANYSAFYGLRSEIRKVLLGRLMPQLPVLTAALVRGRPPAISDTVFNAQAPERLKALDALCRQYGSRIVIVIPPSSSTQPSRLAQAALAGAIPVLRPSCTGQFQPSDFADGFHLNETAAPIYTRQLAEVVDRYAAAARTHEPLEREWLPSCTAASR